MAWTAEGRGTLRTIMELATGDASKTFTVGTDANLTDIGGIRIWRIYTKWIATATVGNRDPMIRITDSSDNENYGIASLASNGVVTASQTRGFIYETTESAWHNISIPNMAETTYTLEMPAVIPLIVPHGSKIVFDDGAGISATDTMQVWITAELVWQ